MLRLFLAAILFAPMAAAAERLVLVPQQTWLYRAPKAGAQILKLIDSTTSETAWTFRYVRDAGDFVEISGHVDQKHLCEESLPGFEALNMRLFVRREDLNLATLRKLKLKELGSAEAELSSGVPLTRSEDGRYTAAIGSMELRGLPLRRSDVGVVFDPPAEFPRPDETEAERLYLKGEASLGDGISLAAGPPAEPIHSVPYSEELRLYTFWRPCALVKVPLDATQLRPAILSRTSSRGFVHKGNYEAKPGAQLYWPDGVWAGTVSEHELALFRWEVESIPDRRCFERPIFWSDLIYLRSRSTEGDSSSQPRVSRLRLCVPKNDVTP